ELGYVEGQNIAIEYRYAEAKFERLPDLAAELVRLNVDVILASSPPETGAAKRATTSIPIVFGLHGDPVGTGHVASLAKPRRNIPGLDTMAPELSGKRLELLIRLCGSSQRGPRATGPSLAGTRLGSDALSSCAGNQDEPRLTCGATLSQKSVRPLT